MCSRSRLSDKVYLSTDTCNKSKNKLICLNLKSG